MHNIKMIILLNYKRLFNVFTGTKNKYIDSIFEHDSKHIDPKKSDTGAIQGNVTDFSNPNWQIGQKEVQKVDQNPSNLNSNNTPEFDYYTLNHGFPLNCKTIINMGMSHKYLQKIHANDRHIDILYNHILKEYNDYFLQQFIDEATINKKIMKVLESTITKHSIMTNNKIEGLKVVIAKKDDELKDVKKKLLTEIVNLRNKLYGNDLYNPTGDEYRYEPFKIEEVVEPYIVDMLNDRMNKQREYYQEK